MLKKIVLIWDGTDETQRRTHIGFESKRLRQISAETQSYRYERQKRSALQDRQYVKFITRRRHVAEMRGCPNVGEASGDL